MFKYFENKMRLSNQQRIESINGVKNKYFVVSNALKSLNIKISGRNLRKIIYKYNISGWVDDKRRTCHKQRLITNRSLLSLNRHLQINSQHTLKKEQFQDIAVKIRYFQLVSSNNWILSGLIMLVVVLRYIRKIYITMTQFMHSCKIKK